jgi:hypothetical protein
LYSKELPWDLAPATFRDAINIARVLGIEYIWVDALCIVQDDPIEWQKEASKMESIYSGSSLTIAATDATNSSGGCFLNADVHSITEYNNTTDDIAGLESDAFFSTRLPESNRDTLVRMEPGAVREYTRNAILNTRG